MIIIQNLVHIDKGLDEPVYQQLANGIVSVIRQGHLKPGAALPSSRKLAELFDIHRKTVVAAFDELQAQGWVESFPRRGLFVAAELPVMRPRRLAREVTDAVGADGESGDFGDAAAESGSGPGSGIRVSLSVPPLRGPAAYPAATDFAIMASGSWVLAITGSQWRGFKGSRRPARADSHTDGDA